MLFSIALIFILGFLISGIFNHLKIPGLLGMIFIGVILGPHTLNLLDQELLTISEDLRELALIVILLRAGLSLNLSDLKRVGRPAVLMAFIPAILELTIITLLAPILLGVTYLEAAIMGAVVAAVSPAVVVPRMIKLIDEGYGRKKSIPQLIMASASVDDIFVIVLFTAFMGMHAGDGSSVKLLSTIPISIILGIVLGIIVGFILVKIFKVIKTRETVKILIILSVAFILVSLGESLKDIVPISGLLSVMALGITVLELNDKLGKSLLEGYSKIWIGAEVLLFVLVGAEVNIASVPQIGLMAVILILSAMLFRVIGVNISLIKTKLNKKERIFSSIAYLPKATVQAAIGAIPLARGVEAGSVILSVAVLAILLTAPLGAIGIDSSYRRLLDGDK